MTDSPMPTTLPPEFHKFFWDIDPHKLDPGQRAQYVINRLLNIGTVAAVRWIMRCYPKHLIVETIKSGRDLSLKTANYWAHYYHIPREEITCMQEPYLSMRKTSWHN